MVPNQLVPAETWAHAVVPGQLFPAETWARAGGPDQLKPVENRAGGEIGGTVQSSVGTV